MGTPSKLLQRAAVSAFLLFLGHEVSCFSSQQHQFQSSSNNSSIREAKNNHSTTASSSSRLDMTGTNSSPPSPGPSPKQAMEQAKTLIARAISVGAPAYNAGDIAGCAKVYRDTAVEIASLLPKTLKDGLEEPIRRKQQDAFRDANEEAWAFREQFDSILGYQVPFVPASDDDSIAANATLEPFENPAFPEEPVVINDNVMGGVSRGQWVSGSNTFKGTTALANNGGFSSLRWRFDRIQNWSYAKGIYLKNVRHSDPSGHTFRLILKDSTCEQVRGANFKTIFANPETTDGESGGTIFVPFEAFDQMEQMGRALDAAPAFNRGAATELGLMAIKPTVVGDFELAIGEWGLYY